ncbi:MAG: ROK family transcriptional regulator [Oscillospiraceae bacterium]|nr:ROK family transcriptional regulator [Oscillospiraceae bacterium]
MSIHKNGSHSLKGHNANSVLSALMMMKTATRKQLAQKTGLSQPTVNSIVQELEAGGVVQPGNFAASAGGRRPQCYTIKTDHLRAATIRVLSQSLEYVVVTVDGTIILRNTWAVPEDEGIMASLCTLLATLLKQDTDIRVVSIGVPGVVGPGGMLYAIPQIPELEGVALVSELNKLFSITIYVENDMNLVALGSAAAQSAESSATDMVFVHIGEGVGAGIVMGGQIIRGFSSFAGEIAFMPYPAEDIKKAEDKGQETLEYLLAQTTDIAKQAKLISTMIISIICILNPPVISFGSKYASEEMLKYLRHECEKYLPHWTLPAFQLMPDEESSYDRGLMALVNDFLKNYITHELV